MNSVEKTELLDRKGGVKNSKTCRLFSVRAASFSRRQNWTGFRKLKKVGNLGK